MPGERYAPIPLDALPAMIGKPVHLSWARPGCHWILDAIDADTLLLRTPKSGRRITAKAADARYVRRFQPQTKETRDDR